LSQFYTEQTTVNWKRVQIFTDTNCIIQLPVNSQHHARDDVCGAIVQMIIITYLLVLPYFAIGRSVSRRLEIKSILF